MRVAVSQKQMVAPIRFTLKRGVGSSCMSMAELEIGGQPAVFRTGALHTLAIAHVHNHSYVPA